MDSIINKVNNRLRCLYRKAQILDVKCKSSICSALISRHLDYACSSRYTGLMKGLKQKLHVCQNKVVGFISSLSPMYPVNYSESPRAHVAKFYGRLRLIRSVWRASKFSVFLKFIEIVILWVYYTIPFGISLFWHFLVITFQLFELHVWLRITDEGSVPEMRMVHIVNLFRLETVNAS